MIFEMIGSIAIEVDMHCAGRSRGSKSREIAGEILVCVSINSDCEEWWVSRHRVSGAICTCIASTGTD